MSNVKTSITVLINSIATEKKSQGIRVYNLSAGEPKILTPEVIRKGAMDFTAKGDIPYPTPAGMPKIRKMAADRMNKLYKTDYNQNDCLLTTGGKYGLYLIFQHLLGENSPLKANSSDKLSVIIPAPYWVSYPPMVKIMGGESVIVKTTEAGGWKITPQMIKDSAKSNTKILVLNNGVNPTSAIYNRAELRAIVDVCKELDITIISDEVYSGLVYTDDEYVSLGSFLDYKENIVIIQSASKNFAMTGWRVGFLFAREEYVKVLTALTSQSTTGVSLICQHGVIAAFENADEVVATVRNAMKERRDVFLKAFKEYFGKELPTPKATLYAFVSLKDLGVAGDNDEEFCLNVLEKANVAIVPGSGFGQAGYVRFSFAADSEDLIGGLKATSEYIKGQK